MSRPSRGRDVIEGRSPRARGSQTAVTRQLNRLIADGYVIVERAPGAGNRYYVVGIPESRAAARATRRHGYGVERDVRVGFCELSGLRWQEAFALLAESRWYEVRQVYERHGQRWTREALEDVARLVDQDEAERRTTYTCSRRRRAAS